ncbi:MAG TPA: hypothetical protein ENJ18_01045 [Nannocystis exedens]|nr:hypothetical protein [Nannocystis exedens]
MSFTGPWGYTQTNTDHNGEFTATVHPGRTTITLSHPRMLSGEPREIEVPETHDPPPIVLTFSALEGGEVHGQVHARSGPLSDIYIVVRAVGNFATKLHRVDDEGRFSIAGLQRIPHEIIVQRLPELQKPENSAPLADPVVVDLEERQRAEVDFFVDVSELATLTGRVEDAEGNAEIDAVVAIQSQYSDRWRIVTDENGFTFQQGRSQKSY